MTLLLLVLNEFYHIRTINIRLFLEQIQRIVQYYYYIIIIYHIKLQKLGLCYTKVHFIQQFRFCSHVILDYIYEQLHM